MSTKLLEVCPFCAADGKIEYLPERSRQYPYFPMCSKCSATLGGFGSEQKAARAWNKRPIEQAQRVGIEVLAAQWVAIPFAKIRKIAEGCCWGREWCSEEEIDSVDGTLAWLDANAPKAE